MNYRLLMCFEEYLSGKGEGFEPTSIAYWYSFNYTLTDMFYLTIKLFRKMVR